MPELSRLRRKAAWTPSSSAAWLMVRAGKSGSSSRLNGSSDIGALLSSETVEGPDPCGPGPSDGAFCRSGLDGPGFVRLALDRAVLDGSRRVGAGHLDLAGARLLRHRDAQGEHAVVVAGLEPVDVQAPAEHELPGVAAVRPLGHGPFGVLQLWYRALRGDGQGLPL